MKNLKKILMAFVLVALLISSVVTVAIAEASYTGTVDAATKLLDEVSAAAPSDGQSVAEAKIAPLANVYKYLANTPVDPKADGYDAMLKRYNDYTFMVAYLMTEAVDTGAAPMEVSAELAKIYAHLAQAPIIASRPSDYEIALGYKCANEKCGTYVEFSDIELFIGITELTGCVDGCLPDEMNLVPHNYIKFSSVEKKLGEASVGVTGTLIDAIYGAVPARYECSLCGHMFGSVIPADATHNDCEGAKGDVVPSKISYYDLLNAQDMAIDFINNSLDLEYKAPVSDVYTGDVAVVSEMLAAIDAEADFNGYSDALADVYRYLVNTPVDPTTAEYFVFIKNYNSACELLGEKLTAAVDALGAPSEKIELLGEFRALLAGKPAVEADEEQGIEAEPAVAAVPFSDKVVNAFNAVREDVIDEFKAASEMLSEIPELNNAPLVFEYDEMVDEFKEKLDTLKALGVEDAKSPVLLASLYNDYIKVLAFDPEAEAYADYIADYKSIACDYVTRNYIEKIENLVQVGDRYTVLVELNTFVSESPLCEEVIDLYNAARLSLREDAVALNSKIGTDKLPVYTERETAESTVSYPVLNKFLSTLQNSYDKYIAASAEDKAASLAAMQKSATEIYYYIKGSVINTSDAEYEQFDLKYSALRESISGEVVALIKNADDAGKLEAVKLAGAFVKSAPLSFAMVDAFNSAAALVEGAEDYLVDSVYYDIIDGISVLENKESSKEEILNAGAAVAASIKKIYDTTDTKYGEVKASFDVACEAIGDIVYADLSYAITNLSGDELTAVTDYYFDYVDQVYTFETVTGLRKALKSTGDVCSAIIGKIDSNYIDVKIADNAYVSMLALIAEFDSADAIEDKFAVFTEIYEKFNVENFTTFFISGPSYASVKAEYERTAEEMKDLIVALLDITLSPSQICENLIAVGEYINALCFSADVVDAYNEMRQASIDMNFAQYTTVLEEECVELSYVSPEGFSTNLSRVYIALDRASLELKDKDTDFEEYLIAYRILSAQTEYYGKTFFDFGSSEVTDIVTIFNNVTNLVCEYWLDSINDKSNSFAVTTERFNAFQKFITENPFSSKMVEACNEARVVFYNNYRQKASDTFDGYQLIVKDLHDHMAACSVKESALSSDVKARYNVLKTLIEAAEYGEVNGYFNHFDNLEGPLALIYQNNILDKLNKYSAVYGLGSYNDESLVIANLQREFYKFVDAFEAEISGLDDVKKERKIRIVGSTFADESFPSELLRIFNSKFGTSFVSAPVTRGTEEGTLKEFGKYIANINAAATIDDSRIAFSEAVEYFNGHTIDDTDLQDYVTAEIEKIQIKLKENTDAAKYELNKKVKLSDYNLPVQVDLHHEDNKLYTTSLSPSSDTSVKYHTIETDRTGNKYAMIETTTSASPYFDLKKTKDGGAIDDSNSLVIELDVMSPDPLNFQLTWTEDGLTYGERVSTRVLRFINGQLDYKFGVYSDIRTEQCFENYVEGVDDPIVAVPGEWMHITIAMDLETMMYELLVDYVSLGKRPIITGASSSKKEDICRYTALRFQTNKAPTHACYDNVKIYGGSAYRTLDFFENMSLDEKFEYYAEYALNESENAVNRIFAYTEAKALIPYITSSVDSELVEALKAYDESNIREAAEKVHLANLEEIVKGIDIDSLTTGTLAEQNASISSALGYIEANRLYIDQTDPRFIAINEELIEANEKIKWFNDLEDYISYVSRFHRSTSHASLVRHYEKVLEYYMLCELNKADKAAIAAKDPLAIKFAEGMNLDESVIELVGKVDFITYFTEYIPARMENQLHLENSAKILDCVGFIESIVPNKNELSKDEYIQELGAKALENYDFVEAYMAVIRNLVNTCAYDPEVEGVDEALEIFEILDEVFFNRLQEIHYEVIKGQLDKYTATSSYIEKAGICAYIENYIEENAVDMTDALGVQYLYALEVYKAELETYKIDYEAILAANTESFLGIVSRMQTYVTYSELKPLYDLAIEKYYYNMNADSDEVKEAISIFEEKEAQLTEWELNGAMLIGYSENLTSRRQAQKYRALVNCANYIDKVDAGVEGVARVIELYNKTLADYNESIEVVNAEISEVSDIVCSVRTESIAATILAIIKNLFN